MYAQLRPAWVSSAAQLRPAWVSASLPTVGQPVSDTSSGSWTPSTGTSLYGCVDEVTPDDADYIMTSTAGSSCEMALATTAYPGGANQVLRYRAFSAYGSTLTVDLKQGSTVIATWTHAVTSTPALYEQTLTSGQIAAITSGSCSVALTAS